MRVAVIDLGTNTFNLVIADLEHPTSPVYKGKIPVKLGEGGIHKGVIEEIPFQRGIDAMYSHQETIGQHHVDKVYAFATSAVRSSSNGEEFVNKIFETTGIDVTVVDGDREAELICKGVRQALQIGFYPALVMDIGGGSTEFIITNDHQIFWKRSFDLGVSRLKEALHPSDPISQADIHALEAKLDEELQPLFKEQKKYSLYQLIGSSGSFDTFADMIRAGDPSRNWVGQAFEFAPEELAVLHQRYLESNLEQRKAMPGMLEFRADMIVLASILVQYVLKRFSINKVRSSKYALKEGVLVELAEAYAEGRIR